MGNNIDFAVSLVFAQLRLFVYMDGKGDLRQ